MRITLTSLLHGLITVFLIVVPFQVRYILVESDNQFGQLSIYAFDIVALAIICVFIPWWYKQRTKVNWPVVALVVSILVLVLLSGYWSVDRTMSLYYWLRLAEAFMIGGIILASRLSIERIAIVFVFNGIVQTCFAAWQTVSQNVVASTWLGMAEQLPAISGVPVVMTESGRFLRAFGTLPHPNILGGLLVLSLVSCALLWRTVGTVSNAAQRLLLLVTTSVLSFGLVLTFSRSAALVWVSCMVVLFLLRYKATPLFITSAVALFVIGGIYAPLLTTRLDAVGYVEQYSISERRSQFNEASEMIKKKLPQGSGIGTYTVATQLERAQPVHNVFVLSLAEIGIFAWLPLWFLAGWAVLRGRIGTPLAIGTSTLVLATIGLSMFDHYVWTIPSMMVLWITVLYMPFYALVHNQIK